MCNMNIYVIIVVYKGCQWYERCFCSLRNATIPLNTIVIDNNSNDGTVEYIKENFPEIYLIELNNNIGFGRANNLGIRYALDHDCDYVFLLNQDTWIKPDSIEKLVSIAKQYPEYGILSPMHIRSDEQSLYIQIEDGSKDHGNQLLADCYFSKLKDVYSFKYINAAAWLITRKTLMTVGGFDPIFYHYEEDDDYLNRVLYHGLKVGIVPAARMVHDHREGSSALSNGQLTIRRQQYLLVRFTNLNEQESYAKYQCYQLRKVFGCFVRGHWLQMQIWWQDFRYLCKMKNRIIFSRDQNILKQNTWL